MARTRTPRQACSTVPCCCGGIAARNVGACPIPARPRCRRHGGPPSCGDAGFCHRRGYLDAGRVAATALAASFQSVTQIGLDSSDRETLPFQPESLDLAVSALALQFVNDLPGVLAQIRRALKPDGLLLAAMIGGDTLTELRQCFAAAEAECEGGVSPRVAPSADLRDIGALLQRAGLALPVTDVDRVVVRYDSAFALMADLRRMGATNILVERRRTPTRRAPCCGWRRSTPSVLPIPTAASAPPSTSSGCPAGRRMRASSSRCGPVRRKRAWRRR